MNISHSRNALLIVLFSQIASIQAEGSLTFLKGLIRNPDKVGAFFPCSRFSAREICSYIDHANGPLRILEIGSGTGALTKEIVNHLQEKDQFDMVELLPEYCNELEKKYGHHKNISIFCASILDFVPQEKYDVIICSLPFNRFKPEFVQEILDHVHTLIKPNGMFSYVELMWIASIRQAFIFGKEKRELKKTLEIMRKFRNKYLVRKKNIYLNVTPITIYHNRIDSNASNTAARSA